MEKGGDLGGEKVNKKRVTVHCVRNGRRSGALSGDQQRQDSEGLQRDQERSVQTASLHPVVLLSKGVDERRYF